MLRANDIRGRVGVDLTAGDAYKIGLSFAAMVRDSGGAGVAVGRDGRLSSPALEAALVDGLTAGGVAVHALGVAPTPVVGFAARRFGLDGAVVVTASHNPSDENGFKIELNGARVSGDALAGLVASPGRKASGGARFMRDPIAPYMTALLDLIAELPPMRVVWDAGSGAAGPILQRAMTRLRGAHFGLNVAVDGRFPAHHADPAVDANLAQLSKAVRDVGADLGVAFDGDGDRVGFVDGDGVIVRPDHVLLLLARDVLVDTPGAAIVADVKSSRTLFEGIAAAGGAAVMAPTGYVRLGAAMRANAAPLAGELSGHIFFADGLTGLDDGLYAALRTLRALARAKLTLRDFRASLPPRVASPELRLPLDDARQRRVLDALETFAACDAGARLDRTDGLRLERDTGWLLVRPSLTESALTLRYEGETRAGALALDVELRALLRTGGVEADMPPLTPVSMRL
ncbi:MAG: phosphomannomutase/phosphoglucomutase [Alphaproteobacteria bacterium]|nr:phosphomannomutase/phosphoglucomutase [Alphaproteobacteria bacterium]